MPPSGTTAERPASCAAGTLRFNTDIGTLEVYRGDTIGWEQIQRRDSQYLGGGTGSAAGTGTRIFMLVELIVEVIVPLLIMEQHLH